MPSTCTKFQCACGNPSMEGAEGQDGTHINCAECELFETLKYSTGDDWIGGDAARDAHIAKCREMVGATA